MFKGLVHYRDIEFDVLRQLVFFVDNSCTTRSAGLAKPQCVEQRERRR